MTEVTKKIRIDLANQGGLDFLSTIHAVQGDAYSRLVAFELYNGGEKYTPPEGTTAIVRYRKEDGTRGNYDVLPDGSSAYTINGNMLTVALAPQVCIVPGLVQLAVGLISGNAEINTFSVRLVVQPNPGITYQSESHLKLAGTVADSGWEPNMYLGTDADGNVTDLSTDKTLTQPGQAADAAKVGEAVGQLKEDLSKKAECSFVAYGSEGETIIVSDDYRTVDFSGESIVIKGATNKTLYWSEIIEAAKQNTALSVNETAITGNAYSIGYSVKYDKVVVTNPDHLPYGYYTLYGHSYTNVVFGPLYEQMLAKKIKTLEVNCDTVAYFDDGFVPEITYNGNYSTIKFDANKGLNLYGGVKGNFSVNDIIAAAKTAGLTVDENNYSITGASYALCIDKLTSTVKALNSITHLPNKGIIILYAHHYKSIEYGPLYEQMLAKKTNARISSLEGKTSIASYLPAYYQAHMEEKSKEILQNMESVGKNGDTFIFITDLHWESNTKNSPSLVRYLEENLNINTILCGGDLINQGTRENMEKNMREAVRAFSNLRISNFPIAFGNHDSNWNDYGGQHEYPDRKFSTSTQYALMQKQSEELISYFTDTGWNFYFDKPATKTRYIILDTGENGAFSAYDDLSKILLDAPTGYHIVIMAHWLYNANISTACTNIQKMIDAYNSRSSVSISTKTYNYSSAVAYISLLLGGHMHKDMNWSTDNGVPVVLTDCDAGRRTENTDYPFVAGTITEQAFDVITLDYINNTVKCVRIGRGASRNFN